MSDKELDDFFRHRAGNPEIPFEPADWKKMQAKLDKSAGIAGLNGKSGYGYRNMLISGAVALLLLGGGVWIGAQYFKNGFENPINIESETSSTETGQADVQEDNPQPKGDQNVPGEVEAGANPTDRVSETGSSSNNAKTEQLKETGASHSGDGESQKVSFTSNTAPQEGATAQLGEAFGENLWKTRQPLPTMNNKDKMFLQLPLSTWEEQKGRIGLAIEMKKEIRKVDQAPPVQKPDFWNESRFSLSLLLAPDVSALKIQDIRGLGTSAGVSVAYFVHPRWSVQTGALYAFKTYQGREGYKSGYGPDPLGLQGDCWVLDVPLNLRFYPISRPLDRWFVSTGLSSYLMLREDYTLEYENNSGEPYSYEVQVKNENQHYLGVLNFSFGYERILSKRLSIQVEPYLKLPISGIGEGEVSLKSAGTLIGLQYNW